MFSVAFLLLAPADCCASKARSDAAGRKYVTLGGGALEMPKPFLRDCQPPNGA